MPAALTRTGSAFASGQPEWTKCMTVRAAAARAPVMKTAFTPMRTLREPASRRALPMRGDIGNSARRLDIRMRDCSGKAGACPGLCSTVGTGSPEDSLVLGLAVGRLLGRALRRIAVGRVEGVRPLAASGRRVLPIALERPSELIERPSELRFAQLRAIRPRSGDLRCDPTALFDPACQRCQYSRLSLGVKDVGEWMADVPERSCEG